MGETISPNLRVLGDDNARKRVRGMGNFHGLFATADAVPRRRHLLLGELNFGLRLSAAVEALSRASASGRQLSVVAQRDEARICAFLS